MSVNWDAAVKNLIADPAHAATLARMRKKFADWRTFTKDADIHPSKIPRRTLPKQP
ncbi:MAG: hypothetical protein ABI883_08555 [Chthoniobacterales bacterium]